GEAHDGLDAGAVVPTAVEDDDLAGSRKMLHVALQVVLGLFAIRGSRQRDHPEHSWADPFGDRTNGPSLTGAVAPFEHDDDPQARLFDPFLQVAELDLQLP